MKVSIQQTEKLLKGNQSFSQLGFSLLLTRLRTMYAKEPSKAVLQSGTDEINIFLEKFGSIMNADYSVISKM